jgi:hypothetical protein
MVIPWQTGYKLTASTLSLLERASSLAGHNIQVDDAWRSYAEQSYYWDQYINHGGNVASNPDTGQRNHMRGAAVDIVNQSDRSYMLQVGFTPDSEEWWHFNDPNWQNMPIVKTDDSSTQIGGTDMGDLSFIQDAQSPALYLQNNATGKRVHIQSPYHVGLLQRAINGDGGMLLAEMDIVNSYETTVGPSNSSVDSVMRMLQVPGQPYGWPQANNNAVAEIATIVKDVQKRTGAVSLTPEQVAQIGAGVKLSTLNISLTGKATP